MSCFIVALCSMPAWLVVSLLLNGTGIAAQATAQVQEPVTAFVDVTVVPMDRERVLPGHTVVVRGDRVVAMGPVGGVEVPVGAVRVNGRGKFLMPGLADMHAHLWLDATGKRLVLYLTNGVTTVRDMLSEPIAVKLQQRVEKGELLGPRIYTARGETVPTQDFTGWVAGLKVKGYDFIKVYGELEAPRLDSVVIAARRAQMQVVGHAAPKPGLEAALRARMSSIEHLTGYLEYLGIDIPSLGSAQSDSLTDIILKKGPEYHLDAVKLRRIAVATQKAGVWNTPTLQVMDWGWSAEPTRLQRIFRQQLKWNQAIVKALSDAGAGLLLGSDSPVILGDPILPGFAIHRELDYLVAAGLSPYQALESGTRNAATFLGTLESTGTVAPGKRADLVLLDGNPLQSVRYLRVPAGVMAGGRWLPRAQIDDSLNAIVRNDSLLFTELLRDIRRFPAMP